MPAGARRALSPPCRHGELIFGLRPEHITERAAAAASPASVPFEAELDVTEPMGMETLVYFPINGIEVCGRVNPNAGAQRRRAACGSPPTSTTCT